MVSAKSEQQYVQKAFAFGAVGYVVKPIIIEDLINKVECTLQNKNEHYNQY